MTHRRRPKTASRCSSRKRFGFALGSLCLLLLPSLAQAQSIGRAEETETNIGAYYKYVVPGVPTVLVQVLGTVRSPGLYELRADIDLGKVLALSGGPVLTPQESSKKRKITIKLFRQSSGPNGNTTPIYEANLDETVTTPSRYPPLQDGDVLLVEVFERPSFTARDALRVANAIALIALAAERVSRSLN